ncbi:hypothetical protein B0J14DRAFT_220621 [Halenospora varia]|nr:hypothetical protein B0J14DRAFT_220621 [Halenospora varia]
MAGTSPQTNQPGQNAYQPPGSIELNPLLNSSPAVQNPSNQIPVDQNVGGSPPSTSVSPLSSASSSNASGLHQTASNSPPSTAQNSRQQSPPQTNGNTTGSPTVTPSPSPPAAINQPSNRSLPRKILTPIWELKSPICAAIVLIITSIMIFTSNSVTGPLATIGVTSSFLVLNVLSQANNYAFVAALDKAWEALQWGPLLSGGGYLTNFLAVSASTGLGGWFRVLFHRGYSGGGRPRTWSAGRIMLALLSQFPGIIFLTLVELETSYKPTNWTPISGGIGRVNTTLATSKARNGILMSGLVLNMFRDATIVKEVPAISESCLRSNSCISYIIPGGTVTIAPWPWSINHTVDSSLSAYMTKDTPVYQLDFWTAPSKGITWATDDCRFYGESSGAFQLCVSPQKGDQIVAGWKPCVGTLDSLGTCRGNYTAWELTPI